MIYSPVSLLIIVLSVQFVQSDTCGRRPSIKQDFVSHGSQSRLGEWPWHAAVFQRIDKAFPFYACGGTIVSSSYIVTAAHCTFTESKVRRLTINELEVRVGITDIQKVQPSLRQLSVARIERHEDYNTQTSVNDIALLQLASELEFTDYVKPICLWMGGDGEEEFVGKLGYVPGWGKDENNELPDLLKHVEMPIISRNVCKEKDDIYSNSLFNRNAFCAGYGNGSSVNSGDSGSGLYIEIDGQWQLRGIVSNGIIDPGTRLLDTKSYIVFTDVAYFRPWIQSKTGQGSPSVQETEDYAVCGKKKESKFQRPGVHRKWPWQGEVHRNTTRLCEVVIVSDFFLLSPADVYSKKDINNPMKLRASYKNGTGHVVSNFLIERVMRHENFTLQTRMHNIALLKLVTKITFTSILRPICLWRNESIVREGHTGNSKQILRAYDECRYPFVDEIVEDSFCFLQHSYTIQSDFLYVRHNGTWYLRGVIFNVFPDFYSDYHIEMLEIHPYNDWIQKQQLQHGGPNLSENQYSLFAQDCGREISSLTSEVRVSGLLQCYCTLISPSLLITTGSCVHGLPLESIDVFHWSIKRPVRKIHLHPNFDNQRLIYNIAIIELVSSLLHLDDEPVCLPIFAENISKIKILNPQFDEDPLDSIITNVETCAKRWHKEDIQLATDGSHICANLEAKSINWLKKYFYDDCENPMEGIGLVYEKNDRYFLKGILEISLANRCDHDGLSEVFINVQNYTTWIQQTYFKCQLRTSVVEYEDDEPEVEWRNLDPYERYGNEFIENAKRRADNTCGWLIVFPSFERNTDGYEMPWYTSVSHTDNIQGLCGATIISSRAIVMTASCTYKKSRIGQRKLKETEIIHWLHDKSFKIISVSKIERHEDYNPGTHENDIALLQLSRDIEFSDDQRHICLWAEGEGEEDCVTVLDEDLESVNRKVSTTDCPTIDGSGKTLCAWYDGPLISADRSSVLYTKIGKQWYLRGLVSNQKVNTTTAYSDRSGFIVFTDIAHYRPWIESKLRIGSPSVQQTED